MKEHCIYWEIAKEKYNLTDKCPLEDYCEKGGRIERLCEVTKEKMKGGETK